MKCIHSLPNDPTIDLFTHELFLLDILIAIVMESTRKCNDQIESC